MPIPKPKKDKKGNYDLGACIRFLRQEGETNSDKRVAICLDKAREGK